MDRSRADSTLTGTKQRRHVQVPGPSGEAGASFDGLTSCPRPSPPALCGWRSRARFRSRAGLSSPAASTGVPAVFYTSLSLLCFISFGPAGREKLCVKASKCALGRAELGFLGHRVSAAGLAVDSGKNSAVVTAFRAEQAGRAGKRENSVVSTVVQWRLRTRLSRFKPRLSC